VRGEGDISRLNEVGVFWDADLRFELTEPPVVSPYVVEEDDIATGLLAYWARGGEPASTWAKVVLGASNVIDLFALEDSDDGSLLLEALWELSEGGTLDIETINIARELTD
jgi:hypothetical protein